MKDKTIEALRGSIEKWHNILHADGEDKGSDNCPLCTIFLQARGSCTGCPIVEKKSDFYMCHNPEYQEWFAHQEDCHWPNQKKIHLRSSGERCPTCRELAQAEYDFLKDLLIDYLSYPAKSDSTLVCSFCGSTPPNVNCPQCHPEIKKSASSKEEEWEDITKDIKWETHKTMREDSYYLCGMDGDSWVIQFTHKHGICINYCNEISQDYKLEICDDEYFRILKRV